MLRRGAANADGAIYTAFYHEITDVRPGTRLRVILGGSPTGIVGRFLSAALGADRPLLAAFGAMSMQLGRLATEDAQHDPDSAGGLRGSTEDTMRALAALGIRACIIRLPPIVHGRGDRASLAPRPIQIARRKKESGYVGDGHNRCAGVHRLDAARLFRLVLENGPAGAAYHSVGE